MLIVRTPFRLPLGGGSTDLPSYYTKHGGFIFGAAINMYLDVFVRQTKVDDKIHFQYTDYETCDGVDELQHNIGREALRMAGVQNAIDVTFKADTPAGTGLGSSGACAVGLLNALCVYKRNPQTPAELAEGAFQITEKLRWGDGKQDPYLVAFGGFTVLDIAPSGKVSVRRPFISTSTEKSFLDNSLLFYTGIRRNSFEILKEQSDERIIALKHRTKELGLQILEAFEGGNLSDFGLLLDAHWKFKRQMSGKMSNPEFDAIYETAKLSGALGGKILGAGGGGYFMFYVEGANQYKVRKAMADAGLKEVPFGIDYAGTRVLLNILDQKSFAIPKISAR